MKSPRLSIATIRNPEFINMKPTDISPLISQCEIKVMYVGENRNKTFMSKPVVTEMAKTLRGCPIVGYYSEEKEDFREHSELITIDEEGVHFEVLTKPYGFVAPDAQVWFQEFEDTDEFGNKTLREYLMTTGYLWTGQFEECQCVTEQGKPHSMELDEKTMNGHWATNQKTGIEFFIVNDANFSKLCILGDDIEPCFEGSNITSPHISLNFTKDEKQFTRTLYSMLNELITTLEGGKTTMDNVQVQNTESLAQALEPATPAVTPADVTPEVEAATEFKDTDTKVDIVPEVGTSAAAEPAVSDNTTPAVEEPATNSYAELEAKYNDMAQKCEALQQEYQKMYSMCQDMAREQKKALIAEFSMLTDEDKKDVVDNIDKYSLDEIESKLSVIGRRKGVNFSKVVEESQPAVAAKVPDAPAVTFNLDAPEAVPDIVQALRANKNS